MRGEVHISASQSIYNMSAGKHSSASHSVHSECWATSWWSPRTIQRSSGIYVSAFHSTITMIPGLHQHVFPRKCSWDTVISLPHYMHNQICVTAMSPPQYMHHDRWDTFMICTPTLCTIRAGLQPCAHSCISWLLDNKESYPKKQKNKKTNHTLSVLVIAVKLQ